MGFNSWLLFCYIIPKIFDISVWFLICILSQLSKMMSFQYLRWKSSLKPVSFGFDPFHFTWTFLRNRYKIYQYILTESPLTLCSHLWFEEDWFNCIPRGFFLKKSILNNLVWFIWLHQFASSCHHFLEVIICKYKHIPFNEGF